MSNKMENRELAAGLANRLRLAQIDLSDKDSEQRLSCMEREINETLNTLPFEERGGFLDLLTENFPISLTDKIPNPDNDNSTADVKAVIKWMEANASTMTMTAKRDLLKQIRQIMNLDTEMENIETTRTVNCELAGFITELERDLKSVWASMAATNNLVNGQNIQNALRRIIEENYNETAHVDLVSALENLRTVLKAFFEAPTLAAAKFATEFSSEYSPEAISKEVRRKGKSMLMGWEVAFWEEYSQAAEKLTKNAIDKKIKECIVSEVLEGMGLSPQN